MQGWADSVAAHLRDLWFPQLHSFRISLNNESIPSIKANNAPDLRTYICTFSLSLFRNKVFASFQEHNESEMVLRIEIHGFPLIILE